jgi:hypothetical protein
MLYSAMYLTEWEVDHVGRLRPKYFYCCEEGKSSEGFATGAGGGADSEASALDAETSLSGFGKEPSFSAVSVSVSAASAASSSSAISDSALQLYDK